MTTPSFDWNAFSTIVSNYNNADASLRAQSEQYISSLREKSMGDTCLLLLNLTSLPTTPTTTKELALVLLRKIINVDSKDKWEHVSDTTKSTLKQTIITLLINESNESLKNKYINVIEELVDNTADFEEKWPELVDLAINIDKYDITNKDHIPLINSLLKTIIASVGFLFENLEQEYTRYVNFFRKVYTECNVMTIKVKVSKLISELLTYGEKEQNEQIEPFVFNMLATALECFNKVDEGNLIEMLEMIIEMSSYEAHPFKKYFNDIVKLVSQITNKKDYTVTNCQKIRELAFDVVVEIVEEIPSLFNKNENILKSFLNNLYMYALENNNDNNSNYNEWACSSMTSTTSYSNVKTIFEDNVRFVYSVIDRLDSSLTPSYFIRVLSELITTLINKDNDYWKYIGLLSLSQVMCYAEDITSVEKVFPFIFSMLNNNNAKLRFASAYCIDEMSSSFNPYFQNKYADKLLPLMLVILSQEKVVRVQCALINAITSFITEVDDNINSISAQIGNYFNTMITLYNGECAVMTKEEILTSISEVAEFIEGNCKLYAKDVLNCLLRYFNEYYMNKVHVNLLPKLMNCITTIGKYENTVLEQVVLQIMECVVEFINSFGGNSNINSNSQKDFRTVIENIINVVYNKHNQQIPKLIDILFKLISYATLPKASTDNSDNDTNDNSNMLSSTGETEDLTDCIKLLKTVIDTLEDKYIPYIPQTETTILSLLNTTTYHTLKVHYAEILASIIKVQRSLQQPDTLKQKSQQYITIIKNIIDKDCHFSNVRKLYVSLGDIIGSASFTYDKADLESLTGILVENLSKTQIYFFDLVKKIHKHESSLKEQPQHINNDKDDEEDDDDDNNDSFKVLYRDQIQEVNAIQTNIIECIENILKGNNNTPLTSTNKYYNIFITLSEKVIPTLYNSIQQNALLLKYPENYYLTALLIDCIFENFLIEFQYQHFIESFLTYLIELSTHHKPHIRQAAIYGVGMFIKKSPNELYEQVALKLYEKIAYVIKQQHIKRDEVLAYENGVAALGKGIMYKKFIYDKTYVLLWINNLPIKLDASEINEQYEILTHFIENGQYKEVLTTHDELVQLMYCLIRCYNEKCDKLNTVIVSLFKHVKNDNNETMRNVIDSVYQNEQSKSNNNNVSNIKTKIEHIMNLINN